MADEPPRRGGRWDDGKSGTTPERDSWRNSSMSSPSSHADERWRGVSGPGSRAPPGPPGRWGEEDRPRGTGWGARGSMEEREMPRRPPPGMGHDDKWSRGPGGWGEHDGRGGAHDRDREWGRREGGFGGGNHWERDPAWMHDGQNPGDSVAGGSRMPPPPARAGPMTAKDIERERQEMQAQWRAQAASKVSSRRVFIRRAVGLWCSLRGAFEDGGPCMEGQWRQLCEGAA